MADPLQQLIKGFPGIAISGRAASEWNSQNPKGRTLIRQSIMDELKSSQTEILDLARVPNLSDWSVSISHTINFGGWVATSRPGRVGLDIEVASRIQPGVVARVATPAELDQSPDHGSLWCAKESIYKALEHEQPKTISQIHVSNWYRQGPFWQFTSSTTKGMNGLVFKHGDLILSVCHLL